MRGEDWHGTVHSDDAAGGVGVTFTKVEPREGVTLYLGDCLPIIDNRHNM
jgi:hypothetical protein